MDNLYKAWREYWQEIEPNVIDEITYLGVEPSHTTKCILALETLIADDDNLNKSLEQVEAYQATYEFLDTWLNDNK